MDSLTGLEILQQQQKPAGIEGVQCKLYSCMFLKVLSIRKDYNQVLQKYCKREPSIPENVSFKSLNY